MGHAVMRSRLYFACFVVVLLFGTLIQTHTAVAADIPSDCTHSFGGWQMVSPAPAFHVEGATALIDGKIYIFSGFADNNLNTGNRVDVYDIATDTWETQLVPRVPMPFEASHIQAATDGQFVWIAGGFVGAHPGPTTDAVWRYDTVNDVWQAGPPLPAPRASGAFVRHGRTLHFISGLADRNNDQPDHWTLNIDDPLATWQVAPPIPQPRNHVQGVAIGDYIYLGGGQIRHDSGPVDLSIASRYNVVTQTWEDIANLPAERSHFEPATFSYNGRVFGFGGRNNQNGQPSLDTAIEYIPGTNTWRVVGDLPTNLIGPVANAYNGYAVVTTGGYDYDQGQQDTWITQLVVNCPPQVAAPVTNNDPRVVLFDMTKSGAVQTGGFGDVGETVTWTVNINNRGSNQENVTVSDTLEPNLELISVDFDRNRGNVTVDGRNIRLFIPNVNPGDTISFNLQTRILSRAADGVIRNTVTLENTGQRVTGIARALPQVTVLPATGETPFNRDALMLLVMTAVVGIGALISVLGYAMMKDKMQ